MFGQGMLWAWFLWLSAGLALEVYGVWFRPQPWDTLSESTLVLLRVDTKPGFWILTALMAFLMAWYPRHVQDLGRDGRLARKARDDAARPR